MNEVLNVAALKQKIIEAGITGKLVPQIASEGTAEELLKQIEAERADLIKAGKIKKEKPLPEITEEEIPFEIPKSWKWVRLANIVFNNGQKIPDKRFSYIDIGSIDNVHNKLNTKEQIIEANNAPSRARKIVARGDIIYATVRPYLHNACIIDKDFIEEPIASTGFAVLSCYPSISNKYLFSYLLSSEFDSYANSSENATGTMYPAITDKKLYAGLVPLPPLSEQKRIVAKIEELMTEIDNIERLQSAYTANQDALKNKLIEAGITGKLVPQIASEGTADELLKQIETERAALIKAGKIKKEKPLPEITKDKIPFEIPKSWKWVRLGDLKANENFSFADGPFGSDLKSEHYIPQPEVRLIQLRNLGDGYWKDKFAIYTSFEKADSMLRCNAKAGDIVIAKMMPAGRATLLPSINSRYMLCSDAVKLVSHPLISKEYLVYFMNSDAFRSEIVDGLTGVTRQRTSVTRLKGALVPLPPLSEQKRIVAKIEELMHIIDKIKT